MAGAAEPRRRALPLSARLVVTYALLVAATLAVVAALVLQLTRQHLQLTADERLAATVASFQVGPARRVDAPDDLEAAAKDWLQSRGFSETESAVIRVVATGDRLVPRGGLDVLAIPGAESVVASAASGWHDLSTPQGPVRALAVPLELDGRQIGTLVVAIRADIEDTLSPLLSGIAAASGIGLLFAALLGALAVRRTLRPLRRMATEVQTIQSTGDLSRRVARDGPYDEVGRLAGAFDRMLGRLEDAFTSQRRFLSDASHELRTPLTVVRGQLELLEEELKTPESRRSLALATEELERMRRIVEDLLLLARLDEGMPLTREPVEVELVLREALLRGMLLARLEARVEAESGLYASADPDRLLQVLTNLVTNAVRHAGVDAVVTLRSRREGDRVVMEVSDTGPGIPPEELPHVFDRLYRGSAARAAAPAGAGLGLSIVASLTRSMSGDVAVESRQGRGTTFRVWLPAADTVDTAPIPEVAR